MYKQLLTKLIVALLLVSSIFTIFQIPSSAAKHSANSEKRYMAKILGSDMDITDVISYIKDNWNDGKQLNKTYYKGLDTDKSWTTKTLNSTYMKVGPGNGTNCTGLVAYILKNAKKGDGADLLKISKRKNGHFINATNWHDKASEYIGEKIVEKTYTEIILN